MYHALLTASEYKGGRVCRRLLKVRLSSPKISVKLAYSLVHFR